VFGHLLVDPLHSRSTAFQLLAPGHSGKEVQGVQSILDKLVQEVMKALTKTVLAGVLDELAVTGVASLQS